MEIKRLSPTSGAEILGVDLSKPLPAYELQKVKDALCQDGIVLFRDQKLDPGQLVAFTNQMGPSEPYTSIIPEYVLPGFPDIISISNVIGDDGKKVGVEKAGQYWHTDGSYLDRPAWASVLYSLEVPHTPEGEPLGNTLFANMAAAYDALPEDKKQQMEGLTAFHQYVHRFNKQKEGSVPPHATRPVILKHPVTGKKLIYVNRGFTHRILGMEEKAAAELFDWLCDYATQEQFRYTHRWKVGDLVMWDNYCSQHFAVPDYGDLRRRMWRTTVRGFPWRDGAFVSQSEAARAQVA